MKAQPPCRQPSPDGLRANESFLGADLDVGHGCFRVWQSGTRAGLWCQAEFRVNSKLGLTPTSALLFRFRIPLFLLSQSALRAETA